MITYERFEASPYWGDDTGDDPCWSNGGGIFFAGAGFNDAKHQTYGWYEPNYPLPQLLAEACAKALNEHALTKHYEVFDEIDFDVVETIIQQTLKEEQR